MLTPYRIFCWSPTTTKFCRQMVCPGNITIEQIAASVSRTPGERVLCVQNWGDELYRAADPPDPIGDPKTAYPLGLGLWPNGQTMSLAQEYRERFRQLLALGVQLDAYFPDCERFPTTWQLTPAQLAAMRADPRWGATGGPPQTASILEVDNYLFGQWAKLFNNCFVAGIHANYAGIPVGNYANVAGDGLPDVNGNAAYVGYVPIGAPNPVQCPWFYGQLKWPGALAADAYHYGIDLLLMARRCSSDRVIPWLPTNSGSGLLKDTPYYRRLVRAAFDICGPNAMCFNPGAVAGDPDMTLLDSIVGESQGLPVTRTSFLPG